MPKLRVHKAKGQKAVATQIKGKIGGRKSNKSVFALAVEELQKLVESTATRGRDRQKIENELVRRGA